MKENYRGYEISCKREESVGGHELLYFSVFWDGLEVICDFTDGNDSESEMMDCMRSRDDEFIKTEGESEGLEEEYALRDQREAR